jgi:DNA-binding CsgD family transcriptional regulator
MLRYIEDRIVGLNSTDDFEKCFEEILFHCGLDRYSYVYTPLHPGRVNEVFIFGNYDARWVETYKSKKFFQSDPVLLTSSNTSFPFFWEEIPTESRVRSEIFDLAHDYGIEKGFSIPIHDPGSGFGSIHVTSDSNDSGFEQRISSNSAALRLLSAIAHGRFSSYVPSSQKPYLSSRERECLYWVSQGKTYSETGLIMGITERTIKFHVNNMMVKLDAMNAKHLISKAISLNLLPSGF